MFERFHRKSTPAILAAVLAALGVSGIAAAQNGGSNTPSKAPATSSTEVPGQESNAAENSATDPDNVQQGDQTTSDKPDGPESANEKADGAQESGSEAVNDDGPGGHADEPGNPNADTQQEGAN